MSELKPCPFEDWWNKEVLHGKSTSFVGIDVHSMRWWTRLAFEAGMNNRPESEAERVLREYGVSRLMSQNIYSLSANARLRNAIDEMDKLAIALAEDKTPKTQDELCTVCGIGSYLPSGMCDHCDSPARKLAGETTGGGG